MELAFQHGIVGLLLEYHVNVASFKWLVLHYNIE